MSNESNYSRVLATEMKRYSEAKDIDALSKVHGQIDELKDIMVKNIESVTSRGEHLGNIFINFPFYLQSLLTVFRQFQSSW